MKFSSGRRRFLLTAGVVGGGLLIGYGLFKERELLGDPGVLPTEGDQVALNAWLKIDAAGRVTVAVPRAEMGQGVYTALPMLVAEELGAAWRDVRAEQAPVDKVYGNIAVLTDAAPLDPHDQGFVATTVRWSLSRVARVLGVQVTGGSTSVRDAWLPMRTAGAAARDMLTRAAAARLDVPPGELEVRDGRVMHAASGRALAFGALVGEAAALAPPDRIVFRDPAERRLLGRPVARTDVPAKVDGSAHFGADVRHAGTVYAAIRIAPVFGGRLGSFDRAALEARPGVIGVVPLDDALVVVGRTWWHAEQALAANRVEFSAGPGAGVATADLFARYAEAIDADDGFAYEDQGDAREALRGADVLRAEYRAPMLAHACMEPMNCSVRLGDGTADIWCGNQAPDLLRLIAADMLDLPPERVRLHTPFLGGGFGRRAEPDFMRYAIAIAQAVPDQTVQLVYSREQDLQHDTYRPPVLSRFAARLDGDGRIAAWHNHIAGPSVSQATIARAFPDLPLGGPDKTSAEGAAHLPYAVPARRVEHSKVDIPAPVGFWRSVGHSYNAFFTECFVDELAAAAATDPFAFRLAHLRGRPRESRVLTLLEAASDWGSAPPAGRARGLALHESFHSIVGQVAEVSIEDGHVRVHRVVCVIDCGQVVNPDIVIAQMESGIVFGLTAALYGDTRLQDGRVQQWNFPDYRMVTMKEMPQIETHVIESGAEPGGVGEPGTPPIAPAVVNAASRLLGRRIRTLPLRSALGAG